MSLGLSNQSQSSLTPAKGIGCGYQSIPTTNTLNPLGVSFRGIDSQPIPITNTHNQYPQPIPLEKQKNKDKNPLKIIDGSHKKLRSKAHIKLANFILSQGPCFRIKKSFISQILSIDKQTILRALKRFQDDGFISHGPAKDNNGRLITEIIIHDESTYSNTLQSTPSEVLVMGIGSSYIERKKEKLFLSARDTILAKNENFPNLSKIGFFQEQLNQALMEREKKGEKPESLEIEIEFLEAWAGDKDWLKKRKKHPANSLYKMLANGVRRPPGYKTRAEKKCEYLRMEIEAQKKVKREAEIYKFNLWLESLSADEKEFALRGKLGADDVWLKNFWEKIGRPKIGVGERQLE